MVEVNAVLRGQSKGRRTRPTLTGLRDLLLKQRLKGAEDLVRNRVAAMEQVKCQGLGGGWEGGGR